MSKNYEFDTDAGQEAFLNDLMGSRGGALSHPGGAPSAASSGSAKSEIKQDAFGTPSAYEVGAPERSTQGLVIERLKSLGYRFLGNKQKTINSSIETELLKSNLLARGFELEAINAAIRKLQSAANNTSHSLYDRNQAVYELLRGGIRVKTSVEAKETTVWLIDWQARERNDFSFAEEVSVSGSNPNSHSKRPDIVIYVNGIALAVLELKRSSVGVGEGIRQCLDNQDPKFIEHFFATNQLIMAGNPTEGIRYGAIGTKAKYYMEWQEEAASEEEKADKLSRHIRQLASPERLLEIVYDFVMFDSGLKKLCRQNQYFAVKAVQEHIKGQIAGVDQHGFHVWNGGKRKGGIIWHTQGSGKSLTMLLIWRWIKEFDPKAKLLIITDRKELDDQIQKVFSSVGMQVHRAKSGMDLMDSLKSNEGECDAVCSLIHKFGTKEENGDDPQAAKEYLKEADDSLKEALAGRNLYVYVDECHRTQSGDMHKAMTEALPNAMLIGFTGTPLLKADKPSVSVFGQYIHKYLFPEAVRDGVILDLRYEARNITQSLSDPAKVDSWFEQKTEGLSPLGKAKLQKEWGKKQKILSSKSRIGKIAMDVVFDFATKPRLLDGARGNAILVCGSIKEACQYYLELKDSELKGKVAVVTSYIPSHEKVKGESTGDGDTENIFKHDVYAEMIAESMGCEKEKAASFAEDFEKKVKKLFVEQPERMRLLIVVDKLLTGFDAPSATYIYLDKPMENHELFQSICRPNRPDPEDESKDYGYIVDYRNLFGKIKTAIEDYTSADPFGGYDPEDVDGLLKDFSEDAYQKTESLRVELQTLCSGVKGTTQQDYMEVFCPFDSMSEEERVRREQKRLVLYKTVDAFVRAVATMGSELKVHYGDKAERIRQDAKFYEEAAKAVKLGSGDYVDMKLYEPHMRRLIDQYIDASPSKIVEGFEDLSLVEMIVKNGDDLETAPEAVREIIGEGQQQLIANNIRALLVKSPSVSASAHMKMSELLEKLLLDLKKNAIEYRQFLAQVKQMVAQIKDPSKVKGYPKEIGTRARQDLYALFGSDEQAALEVDEAIRKKRQDMWREVPARRKKIEIEVRQAVERVLAAKFGSEPDLDKMVAKMVDEVMDLANANMMDYPS